MDNPDWVRNWHDTDHTGGQGMLYGLGTHSIDQTLVLFGLPASVTALTRVYRTDAGGEEMVEDTFTIVLQYEGKLVCTIKTAVVSPVPAERALKFWVRGREGAFIKVSAV